MSREDRNVSTVVSRDSPLAFSFGVLSYNQAETIVETLESIKFQILTFGSSGSFDLIVVDDRSSDASARIAQAWLDENAALFSSVALIVNEVNRGTVYDFGLLVESLASDRMKIIAADDVFASGDLFYSAARTDRTHIVTHPRVVLNDGSVEVEEAQIERFYVSATSEDGYRSRLKKMRRGGYLHTPSTLFSRSTYDAACCADIDRRYRLLEDDPTWYRMLRMLPELEVVFERRCLALYRISDRSVSNGGISPSHAEFLAEIQMLTTSYLADTRGLEHLYLWCRRAGENVPKYLRLNRYLDCLNQQARHLRLQFSAGYRSFRASLTVQVEAEQHHYDEIARRARDFEQLIGYYAER
jgi:glycosyltransferase involved in cell wall biosynthesis